MKKKTPPRWRPKKKEDIVTSSEGRGIMINRILVLEKLKPYFQIDLWITRACDAYNSRARGEYMRLLALQKTKRTKPDYIARRTVQTWYETDEAVRLLIDSWRDTTNVMARQTWQKKISTWDYTASKEWLERKEKKEFSPKSEVWFTDPEWKPVTPIVYLPDNGRK